MTGTELISLFDVLTDNLSELTEPNKLALLNRKYHKLMGERDWEDTRTTADIAITNNAIALPSTFKKFVPNEQLESPEYKHVFYIGNIPYPILRMAERKKFTDFPYHDPSVGTYGSIIVPASITGTATLDFFSKATDLAAGTSPVIADDTKHEILSYMMAVEHYSIDQSEGGRSKEQQYQVAVDDILEDLEYDDSQLKESWINH